VHKQDWVTEKLTFGSSGRGLGERQAGFGKWDRVSLVLIRGIN